MLGVCPGFIDTNTAARVEAPKKAARDVAEYALTGLRQGEDV